MSAKFKNGINVEGGNLALRDTSAAYNVTITPTSSTTLTADRILTLDLVNGARTLKLGANLTVSNALTLAGTDSTTMTFPSTSASIARTDAGQTFTGTQTVQVASTQDSIKIVGRAGGTSSYGVTITPTTLSNNRTLTLADGDTTLVSGTMAAVESSNAFTGANTFYNATGQTFSQTSANDGIIIQGRSAGTNTYRTTLTTGTLSGSYSITIPATTASDTLATLGLSQTFTAAQTITPSSTATGLTIQNSSGNELPTIGSELLLDANWGTLTNWTKIAVNQYQHTAGAGNTQALTNTVAAVLGGYYAVQYTVTGRTAGTFTITFGGVTSLGASVSDVWGLQATSTGTFSITPSFDFDGTIAISLKRVTTVSTPTYQILDSSSNAVIEARTGGVQAGNNTFIGWAAGARNLYNLIGTGSGQGFGNSGIGSNTLGRNLSGYHNTAVGSYASFSNTSGYRNTSVGYAANYLGATNAGNTAIGYATLYNSTAGGNTAVGLNALNASTTGANNTAIGYNAITTVQTGSNNVAVGQGAAPGAASTANTTAIGTGSLISTTGNGNTALGYTAGNNITSGTSNTMLGSQAGTSTPGQVNSVNYSTAIGYTAVTSTSGQVVIGNPSLTLGVTQNKLHGELVVGGGTSGSLTLPYRAITGAATLTYTDYTIDCTSGTFTVTLPSAGTTATTTATQATIGTYSVVVASATNITVGSIIASPAPTGLPANAVVQSVSGTTIGLNVPTTAALSSASVTFVQQGNATAAATIGRIYNIKNSGTGVITIAPTTGATTTATATTGAGQTSLVVASATGIAIGNIVSGTGIVTGTKVSGVSGTTITIDTATNASWVSGGSVTFTQTIDGATTYIIDGASKRYQTLTVQSTGSNWIII